MAIFGKKKENSKTNTEDKKNTNPTLDLIKETMNEVKDERAKSEENKEKTVDINDPAAQLRAVAAMFAANRTQENLNEILKCLQNPKTLVTIGAQVITGKEDEEKMKNGNNVKLEQPIKINPMLLTDSNSQTVFPIFSGADTMPDDMREKTTKVNLPFANCIQILQGLKNIDTFVLNPYTSNVRFSVNVNGK